jgi:DGQHR domain-containing protein
MEITGGMSNQGISNIIKGLPVIQNKQDFVVGVFTISQILKFTRYTNRLIIALDEEGKPIYNDQIQRFVENSRVNKISDFLINDPEATFPTNLVLHIPQEVINNQIEKDGAIILEIENRVFNEVQKNEGDVYITIIDGQHRVRGIEVAIENLNAHIKSISKTLTINENKDLQKKLEYYQTRLTDLKNIQLVVTFFIDKTLEYQAMIFSTINRTQKKVSADLVSSLFGLTSDDSPQKTALQVTLALNSHSSSPFYKRIKLYGGTYSKNESPPVSQSTVVKSILSLISENLRESENDRFKPRNKLTNRSDGSKVSLPFRKFYAHNNDSAISDIMYYYFNCVRKTFINENDGSYWDISENAKSTNNILQTTVGYSTLMKLLAEILKKETPKLDKADLKAYFKKYLDKTAHIHVPNVQRYSFNNRGKKFLYLDMSLAMFPPENIEDKRIEELKALEKDSN